MQRTARVRSCSGRGIAFTAALSTVEHQDACIVGPSFRDAASMTTAAAMRSASTWPAATAMSCRRPLPLSRCTENFICEHVTELDGKCYARRPVSAELPSFDCALSDEEILTHQNEDYASHCTERPSVTCTTARDCPRGLACSDEGICVGCGPSCYDDDGRPVVCIDQPRCAEGEFCIASVCLPGANIDCIDFTQCSEGEDCVLSGIDAS